MTIQQLYKKLLEAYAHIDEQDARAEIELILERTLALNVLSKITHPEQQIAEVDTNRVFELLQRRQKGEPLAYILGEREFYGLKFNVSPAVLIPRQETELLVDRAIERSQKILKIRDAKNYQPIRILDIGCGSGCIGLAILKHVAGAQLTAIDISTKALEVAQKNAHELGLSERVEFVNLDFSSEPFLFAQNIQSHNKFDIVVANPPYIAKNDDNVAKNVNDHEPHGALYSDKNGLGHIMVWASQLPALLAIGGAAYFEIGATQGKEAQIIFEGLNFFSRVELLKDYSGLDRVVCGVIE